MSLRMTKAEREAFLAEPHVGVLSVAATARGPISVPVWYAYEPGGDVVFMTGTDAAKTVALRGAGRAALVAQREALPYAHVSVEGRVTFEADSRAESAAIAVRYLGAELGAQYMQASVEGASVEVRLKPERWRTEDYGKR
ncbi:MAG: pyridoxamine 5'-phosphate oxidase [Anaerolinea sp.]|nr:pyridoxamine 5'-phosphate oxidase [Anaerolinea sp.]